MPLVRLARGLRVPEAAATDPVSRLAALHTLLPPDAVFSDRTAAELHGLWLPGTTTTRPHVTVPARSAPPASTNAPKRPELLAHRRTLSGAEIVVVAGIRVTSLDRTWCDLAETLSLPDLVAAGDSALQRGVSPADLADALDRRRGRRGRCLAREALPLLTARSRSRPESHLRVGLVAAGLPLPLVNTAVHDEHGQWLAEPDLAYPEARLAIEYQGAHHAEPGQLGRDLTRTLELQRAGWLVLAYGARDLRQVGTIAADVRAVLADRAPELLARDWVARGRRCVDAVA